MSTATQEPSGRAGAPCGSCPRTSGIPFSAIPLPSTDLERASTSFTNFFLHIHPVKVNRNTLRPIYTMGLGLISLFLFVILVVTGVLLMFYYVPSTTQAYDRMLDLRGTVAFGIFLRNMHRWSAHGMVAMVFLHMCRVFLTGAYKKPREFNWVIGVVLLLVTLFLSFTGYLLPWDQLAFWAITVGTSIAGYAPLIGKQIQFVLLGDTTVGQEALLRFYVLHVAVLPAVLTLLVAIHFWRIRKDGGLSRAGGKALAQRSGHRCAWQPARSKKGLRTAGLRARTVHQGRQRAGRFGLQLAEPADGRAVRVRADGVRHPGGFAALQRAAGTAGQRDASAQSGQGALVLPGLAGDGELLGVLGRRRHAGRSWWCCCCWCPISTAARQGVGRWFAQERLLANTIS